VSKEQQNKMGADSGKTFDSQGNLIYTGDGYDNIGGEYIKSEGLKDLANQNASISVFGDIVTAKRVATIASQFVYGINEPESKSTVVGSGTAAIENGNMLVVRTGTTPGSVMSIETIDPLQYIPGYEAQIWFTPVYTKPNSLTGYCRAGLFDDDDGFYIGFAPDMVVCRRRAGVEYPVPRAEWNVDKLDGEGPSGVLFDDSNPMGNIFRIRYGFLGFAGIIFEILNENSTIFPFHIIKYPNTSKLTHIANTYLPGRIEVANGDVAEDISLGLGSFNMTVVNGDNEKATNRNFSLGVTGETLTGAYSRRPLIAFRNKTTFQGPLMPSAKINRIGAILQYLNLQLSGQNKGVLVELISIDSTSEVGGAPFIDKATTSVLQYSTSNLLDYGTYVGGEVLFTFGLRPSLDKFDEFLESLNMNLRPSKDVVFALTSTTTLAIEYIFTNAWREKY